MKGRRTRAKEWLKLPASIACVQTHTNLQWQDTLTNVKLRTTKRTATTSSLADKMLDLAAECFDAPTLDALAKLRLNPKLAARVDRLAEKANEGELTERERAEYQAYVKTSELLALIQLRARLKLRLPTPAE